MLLLRKRIQEKPEEPRDERFSYTSKYINDELELIQNQQENIIRVAEELEKALTQTDKIKELIQLVKKIDKIVTEEEIEEKRRQEAKMINLIEDVKGLIRQKRYEDIEKLMLQVQQTSQLKIKLSQEEMHNLRGVMDRIVELYKESAGLCRFYMVIYEHVKQIYNQCERELSTETAEEVELSGAGSYTEYIHKPGGV